MEFWKIMIAVWKLILLAAPGAIGGAMLTLVDDRVTGRRDARRDLKGQS